MPSQFSALGFTVSSGEDLAALASHVAGRADTINAREGQYLKWAPPSGEQLWLQVRHNGDAMGMNPHFSGKSCVPVTIEARVSRPAQTPLDGAFLAWGNPSDDGAGGGYPLAFDCPDAARHESLTLPVRVDAQIAAFAQQLTVFETEAACLDAQAAEGMTFGSRTFIPSGLISPSGEPVTPPESHALITGLVLETSEQQNSVTGAPFWWALVETDGGTFDVVVDPELLSAPIQTGNVVSGWFWLSGRLLVGVDARASRGGWFTRLTGRGRS